MDLDIQRAIWKLDNHMKMKEIQGFKAKSLFAIKIILLTPIIYLDKVLTFIVGVGIFSFILWFWSLVIRALLKYLGE